jgi:hypothetical protein
MGLIPYVPVLRTLFHFNALHAVDVALCIGSGVVSIRWFELLKPWPARLGVPAGATHAGNGRCVAAAHVVAGLVLLLGCDSESKR